MLRIRLCKRLFGYTAITVLLSLAVLLYRYAYTRDYSVQQVVDPIDEQRVVIPRVSSNGTTLDGERRRGGYLTTASGPSYTSYDTKLRHKQWSRYVLVWNYWEQLTMATNNLFSLLWFCQHWNASIIMPFVHASRFYGLWKRWDNKATLPLDLLYDRSKFNSLLGAYRLPALVPIQTFLSKANRSLVVLQFFYNGDTMPVFTALGGSKAEVVSRFKEDYVFECSGTVYMKKILAVFLDHLNERAAANPFAVKACYCVNASHAIYPDKLAEIIAIQGESDVSIVFNNWRGVSESDTQKATPLGKLKNYRMFVPGSETALTPHSYTDVFPYSLYVKSNASNFIHSLTGEAEYAVVHLRSEKLGQRDERINGYFAQCWAEVKRILHSDIVPNHPNMSILYFTDYGLLGSDTCLHNCRGARITNAALASDGLKASHFDPAKFNARLESGFVALVEQSAMAMSRFLLLVGGGSFQTQIRQQFKSQPTAKKGYTVCTDDKIATHSFT